MSVEKTKLTDGQRDNIIASFKGNESSIIDSLITMFMDMDVVEYNIVTALYGGINYWAGLDSTKKWKYPENHKKRHEDETQDVYIARLILEGGAVKFYDVEDESNEEANDWYLDLNKMVKGFILMMQKSPSHFADLLAENGDATTSDVYIQYCLLGDIVYG